jgi:hypothetical protein
MFGTMIRRLGLLALIPVLLLGVVEPTGAAPRPGVGVGQFGEPADRQGISLEQATRIARATYGGRVVSARPAQVGSESGYQIRLVLEDGRVINVFVDGQGRVR